MHDVPRALPRQRQQSQKAPPLEKSLSARSVGPEPVRFVLHGFTAPAIEAHVPQSPHAFGGILFAFICVGTPISPQWTLSTTVTGESARPSFTGSSLSVSSLYAPSPTEREGQSREGEEVVFGFLTWSFGWIVYTYPPTELLLSLLLLTLFPFSFCEWISYRRINKRQRRENATTRLRATRSTQRHSIHCFMIRRHSGRGGWERKSRFGNAVHGSSSS